MRIDAHQHFWKAGRGDYHWMGPAVPALCRDFLPPDLLPSLGKHKIDRTVLVQAAQTVAETDFLLELAEHNNFIAGVVGWLDLDSPDFSAQFERYRQNPKFIGLRPMLQDLSDDAWIVRPQVLRSLQIIADADFPFEFLTYTRHLPYVVQALENISTLRAVIDHISKPEIRNHTIEPWKELIAHTALHKNVFCKLSGMITEADHEHWTAEDLRPYTDHVLDCFGWDRVIYGSDWPVCTLAGSYDQVVDGLIRALGFRMDAEAEKKLFGSNALRFYKLDIQ